MQQDLTLQLSQHILQATSSKELVFILFTGEQMELPEEQKEIIRRVSKHYNADSLTIARLPKETKEMFMKYAEDFCGDYGMALKQLLDFTMVFGPQIEGIQVVLSEHEQRLNTLETKKEIEQKPRRTLGGKEISSVGE